MEHIDWICWNDRILTTEEKCESSYSKSTSLYQKIVNINLVIPRHIVKKNPENTKDKEKNLVAREKRCNLHRSDITLVADLKTSVQYRR